MCPNGKLRPVIADLAGSEGAYIIVSSEGSTAESALANRRKAMAKATEGLTNPPVLDFYDRTRLASWVSCHAGLVVWVRSAIGKAIQGWEPFGAWAYLADGTEAEYLLDQDLRIRARPAKPGGSLSIDAGLRDLRDILRNPGSVARLVGLSGVGKTRFIQALFDTRIGEEALDQTLAVYTNMNNNPSPQPFSLACDLLANGTRAILIIDNCASDLHSRLSERVKTTPSSLSVITIEYDIREDQPEGTEVFELQVASIDLIEKLLRKRFPTLSHVDARTAAKFSGGNARIAIALANTVSRGGTLASLNDLELFERLFLQRQGQDRTLLELAQACALVYSFDGEDLSDGEEGELARISRMVGVTADQAYRHVAELLRRDLAQQRGKWRAILPHALANRLAETALQNIPFARIQDCLINGAPERLTKSFSRRLGYLDTSQEAIGIVREWFDPKGWIGSCIWNLNEFGKAIFQNSLPANPEAGLRALEAGVPVHGADTPITTGNYVPHALRSLAWDASLFDRCVALLQLLAVHGEEIIAKEATEIHTSLFHLILSGTHASVEQRAAVVNRLLNSANPAERALGLSALNAMLKSMHFGSLYDFQFGGHSRDYGYLPKTSDDSKRWYKVALAIAERVALSDSAAASAAKAAISDSFRGLWTSMALRDELESIFAKFAAQGFWRDGWLAVKQTRCWDEKDKASENYLRLSKLEKALAPRDLVQRVRGRVLGTNGTRYDDDDIETGDPNSFHTAMERKTKESEGLGGEVANDKAALQELMPEIVGRGINLFNFGMGLARGAQHPEELWHEMVAQFAKTSMEHRDVGAFRGMLFELRKKNLELTEDLLDQALESEPLATYFPLLQASVGNAPRGIARLNRALELGRAPIEAYAHIHLGGTIEAVPGAEIAKYIMTLAKAPNGENVAIDVLSMQFFSDRQDKRPHVPELVEAGRKLLCELKFDRKDRREDYNICQIVEVCLAGGDAYGAARTVCENIKRAAADYRTYGFDHDELLKTIFKFQSRAALDAFLTGDDASITAGKEVIKQANYLHSSPVDQVGEDTLLAWCGDSPVLRFPIAASVVSAFVFLGDHHPTNWNPIATRLVHSAPEPIAVLSELISRFRPTMWSGARSTILDTNASILDKFDTQGNESLAAFIAVQRESLQRDARAELEWETRLDRDRDERFE